MRHAEQLVANTKQASMKYEWNMHSDESDDRWRHQSLVDSKILFSLIFTARMHYLAGPAHGANIVSRVISQIIFALNMITHWIVWISHWTKCYIMGE